MRSLFEVGWKPHAHPIDVLHNVAEVNSHEQLATDRSQRPMIARSCRLDAIRGLALLMIFADHCEVAAGVAVLSPWTLQAWYWSDAAEIFVFLAGLVCGASYLRILERDGFYACQLKAMRRAFQIYLTNLGCLAVIVCAVVGAGPPASRLMERLQYAGLHHGLGSVVVASVVMAFQPLGVDVLTLYIQFVATLPLLLVCWRRWPFATKVLCLEAYLVAQWFVWCNVPRWPADVFPIIGCGRHFHHLAWNSLFFLGALVAIEPVAMKRRGLLRAMLILSATGVGTIVATSVPGIVECIPALAMLKEWHFQCPSSKVTLGPFRLAAFLMLALVASVAITETCCRRLRQLLAPVMLLGRNSLLVYAMGLVFTHLTWCWLEKVPVGVDRFDVLAYEVICIAAMVAVAWQWERRSRTVAPVRPF